MKDLKEAIENQMGWLKAKRAGGAGGGGPSAWVMHRRSSPSSMFVPLDTKKTNHSFAYPTAFPIQLISLSTETETCRPKNCSVLVVNGSIVDVFFDKRFRCEDRLKENFRWEKSEVDEAYCSLTYV